MPIVHDKPQTEEAAIPGINPRAVIGGNEPPVEERIAMEFRDALLSERPDFETLMANAIAAVDRAEVVDDETLGKAGDLDKILRASEALISETHKAVKEPYLTAGRACDTQKNALIGKITPARAALRDKMNEFMAKREAARRAEEARIAAEQRRQAEEAAEAERQRQIAAGENNPEAVAEIEAVALAPTIAQRAEPVRSDAGSTVSGRQVFHSEVVDIAKAFKAVKSNPKVQDAIATAVAGLVRAGTREIPGVKIWATVQAVAR